MWFKCGAELLNCAIMRDLAMVYSKRDSCGIYRKYYFLLLLSETADDRADDLQDAEDLARLVDTTPKQAQIVWDVLIKHNVLRKGPQGYSAKAWMIERGILGDRTQWQQRQNGGGDNRQHYQESKNSFFTQG